MLTVGTLVYLFLLALIVGHRKPRLLERFLFFVCLAAFFIYAGKLLEINSFIQYGTPPLSTQFFYTTLVNVGIILLPGLFVAVQLAYLQSIDGRRAHAYEWALIGALGFLAPLVWVLGLDTSGCSPPAPARGSTFKLLPSGSPSRSLVGS